MSDVPEPWKTAMERAGLTDPRNGRASMSRLAEEAGTHTSTISAMIHGRRETKGELVERVAAALDMGDRLDEVFAWVGRERRELGGFVPHPDAQLLTAQEREVVNELIRVMVAGRRSEPPRIVSLDEAIAMVDGPVFDRLPLAIRPDLVTYNSDGTLTVWELAAKTSSWGKNKNNRLQGAMGTAQAVQSATGMLTRAVVVQYELKDESNRPGGRVWPEERTALEQLLNTASRLSGLGLSVVPDQVGDAVAAHEEDVPTAGEQEESDTP